MKSKNKKICLVVLTAILVISAFSGIPTTVGAQPVEVWNVTWSNSMGSAIATAGDCVYLAGANSADTDAFLVKFSEPTPSPTPTPPGFEAGFAIVGLLAVAYLVLRRRK